MKSEDKIHLLKELTALDALERVIELVTPRLDDLLADRIEVNKKYLTIKGACEYLGVGRSTFYNLIKKFKPMKIKLGDSPRYALSDLDKMFKLVH